MIDIIGGICMVSYLSLLLYIMIKMLKEINKLLKETIKLKKDYDDLEKGKGE